MSEENIDSRGITDENKGILEVSPEKKEHLKQIANLPKLTKKNKRFCQFYTDVTNPKTFLNGTQSAIQAGYGEKDAASRACNLLKSPKIIQEVNRREKEIGDSVNISKDGYIALLFDSYRNFKQESVRVRLLEIIGRVKGYLDGEDGAKKQTALFQLIQGVDSVSSRGLTEVVNQP